MKYKVGDKVRVVGNNHHHQFNIGNLVEIKQVYESDYLCYGIDNSENKGTWLVDEEDIMPLDYTWENFLKAPIGTKITFENGDIFVKSAEDCFDNGIVNHTYREMKYIDEDEDIEYDYKKIIKIEEPTYITVCEQEKIEEMTMEEVCKALGKNIKIVKEKKENELG